MIKVLLILGVISLIPQAQSLETNKMCQYRDEPLFPRSHWNLKVGAGCYFYCPKDWFLEKAPIGNMKLNISGTVYNIPYTKIGNRSVAFNYTNLEQSKLIASTFKTNALYQKWVSCARNGDLCCDNMNANNIISTEKYPCAVVWDAWTCFEPAEADSVSEMPCPEYTSSSNSTPCILNSRKECWQNGTWNPQTDYSSCAAAPIYRRRHRYHLLVLYVSIALCFPAVIIFLSYRNLRILRVILHRNLLIACIVRNILAAIQKEVVILDSLRPTSEGNNVLDNNGVFCRILSVLTNISANAIYACMLLDAFYLHKLIVRIFSPDPNIYILYGVATVLSVLPTTIWAILFATQSDEYCWTVERAWYQWVPDGFRIGILSLNFLLLVDIFRGLLTKLKQNVNTQHTKYAYFLIGGQFYTHNAVLQKAYISTLKAMSFLIPLFGVPFIFTANRDIVDRNSCFAGDMYYYISYTIQGLQGFMVALLFCYWNKESQNLVKGTWRKLKIKFDVTYGTDNHRRPTTNVTQLRDTRETYIRTSGLPGINNIAEKKITNGEAKL